MAQTQRRQLVREKALAEIQQELAKSEQSANKATLSRFASVDRTGLFAVASFAKPIRKPPAIHPPRSCLGGFGYCFSKWQ